MNAAAYDVLSRLPAKITVKELLSSRYGLGARPFSWDQRTAGIDLVRTEVDQVLRLDSTGGQSPPTKNWILMLTAGNAEDGYKWTLYGLPVEGSPTRTAALGAFRSVNAPPL